MSQANDIRHHVIEKVIQPARARGETDIEIRAGDVHDAMQLQAAHANVCNALGGSKFAKQAHVTVLSQRGPPAGSNTYFHFRLDSTETLSVADAQAELQRRFGDPISESQKMVSFALSDGRQVALDAMAQPVQLWFEALGVPPPELGSVTDYQASQGRHSNLPDRLSHDPPAEQRAAGFPQPVVKISVKYRDALTSVLDWYQNKDLVLDRAALERLKTAFLAAFPDCSI